MADKWHISPKTGKVEPCMATKRGCLYGGQHYTSQSKGEKALQAREQLFAEAKTQLQKTNPTTRLEEKIVTTLPPTVSTNTTVAELEQIVLTHPEEFQTDGMKYLGYFLDHAIENVAQSGTDETVWDILRKEDDDGYFDLNDSNYLTYVHNLVKYKINVPAVVDSDRNLLHSPATGDWTSRYSHALALFLQENGKPCVVGGTYYGWADYDFPEDNKIVAVLSVKEDMWEEFEGTFVEETIYHHGMSGEAVYEDGSNRIVRWEGSVTEAMRKILK